jgi:Winged helix-turn helix
MHPSLYVAPSEQREQVVTWLKTKNYWNLDELVTYLDEHYSVIYQSKQSYYELLSSAGISWKKSQKTNPKFDPALVKKSERKFLSSWLRTRVKLSLGAWLSSSWMSAIYYGVMFVDMSGVKRRSELKYQFKMKKNDKPILVA